MVEHTKGFVSDVVADDTVQRTGKENQINGRAHLKIVASHLELTGPTEKG